MSRRTRLTLMLLLTAAAVGGAIFYSASRARLWHGRGWTGVYYFNGPGALQQARMMGLHEYDVVMTASGSPADGKLLYRDEILSINGIRRDDTAALVRLDEQARRGSTVVYRVKRGGRILDVPLRLESPLRSPWVAVRNVSALIVALVFVAIAVLVIWRAPDDDRALVFYMLAVLSAVAIIGSAATIYEQSNARGILSTTVPGLTNVYVVLIASMMYPPLILHLALIFPRRRPFVERHPVVIRWIYAVALLSVLMLLASLAALRFVSGDQGISEEEFGAVVTPLFRGLVTFAVLVFIHILWAARTEGVARAIGSRPFRTSLAVVGLLLGLTSSVKMLLSRMAAGILGGGAIVLPLLILGTFPLLACIALIRSYRSANVEEKRQVAWPLWGLIIAIAARIIAFVTVLALTAWITVSHSDMVSWRFAFEILQTLPTIVTLTIPLSFAAAILKYRLMNIDIIIRRTVVYAILSTVIVVMYLGVVGGLGSLLVTFAGLENQTMVIGSTLVMALLFVPLRNRLQNLVDRNLFRHKYDYPAALRAISEESRTTSDAGVFLTSSAEKIQQALQNRAIVIFLERQDEFLAAAKVGVADTVVGRLRIDHSFAENLKRPFDPRRRELREDASAALSRVGAALVVPAGARAFLAAAPKLSGSELDVEDIDFLSSVGEQIGMAVDRIRMQVDEADFAQARAIQQTLLPREMPDVERVDVSGVWHPARTMGGDYYDLIELSRTELAVCIGDVAGKGMPAALLMSGLQAAVRASASNSPRDLCERVRRVVVSSLSGGRFVTFFYATIDTASMTLRWCNAGHNAPILARADGSMVRLSEGGPAFSRLFRTQPYSEHQLEVRPGDRLVLFTDGVSEAGGESGEQFGEQRIEDLVAQNPAADAAALQHEIVEAASAFAHGELEDDVTLVVVRLSA